MSSKVKFVIVIFISCFVFLLNYSNSAIIYADELKNNIDQQLENIDLDEFEEYFNESVSTIINVDFFTYINKILNGEYDFEFETFSTYLFDLIKINVKNFSTVFIEIFIIALICGILQKMKSSTLSSGVSEIILFVGLLAVILILSGQIISIWKSVKIAIENIAKLTEIMSPIILTLMVAAGGSVSASVYKPAVAFLSNTIINVMLNVVLPLIALMIIFNTLSNFSSSIKLDKFSDVATNIIKWIVGLIIAVFGIFLSIQGITSATFDGISIKATKFALSNSIPLVGGFLKDGFDLVVAGSVLIKNAVGISAVVVLFYSIISPIMNIAIFSLLLKFVSAMIEPISDTKISSFCFGVSKCITYLSIALITVGFMLFITILLMTISCNSFF